MTLGSLFDGIGTWQLAAVRNGIRPLWSSEIEKFPIEVTARHFPDTIQLGDINRITDAPKVDIITAGSPCQDISIAGKQGGIHGERSGLFFRATELVRRINPKFFIWENVPNVLHIRGGLDFKTVLEEILQTDDIPIPERGWSNAGLVDGRRSQVAWRMLDSQYWGVPQRRKRIFLVSDFRDRRAAKILFEPAGLRGNSAPCEVEKQTVAARTRRNSDFAVYENHGQDSRIKRLGDIAPTISAKYGTGGNNVPLVAYSIASNIIGRQLKNGGNGTGFNKEISYTLTATDRHAVAYGIGRDAFNQGYNAKFMPTIEYDLCPPLMARGAAAVATQKIVRRLTPIECERLQGLPDDWTAGGSDAARYKAIGNGMALPIAEFILRRIKEAEE